MKLFHIIFDDNTTYEGGTLENTYWKEIPDKKIRSLFYQIPFGDILCLSGYDKYYHIVECTCDLNGDKKGQTIIHSIRLLARKNGVIKIYQFNLLDRNKPIEIKILSIEDEFIKKLNPSFWKG